jgi:hypothetical protein
MTIPAPSRLSGEDLELLKHGYRHFYTVQLYCVSHGLIRLNLELVAERWPCPLCGIERECGRPLQHGYTRQELPNWNVRVGPINWAGIAESEPAPKERPEKTCYWLTAPMIRTAKAELALAERGLLTEGGRLVSERRTSAEETRQDALRCVAGEFLSSRK